MLICFIICIFNDHDNQNLSIMSLVYITRDYMDYNLCILTTDIQIPVLVVH